MLFIARLPYFNCPDGGNMFDSVDTWSVKVKEYSLCHDNSFLIESGVKRVHNGPYTGKFGSGHSDSMSLGQINAADTQTNETWLASMYKSQTNASLAFYPAESGGIRSVNSYTNSVNISHLNYVGPTIVIDIERSFYSEAGSGLNEPDNYIWRVSFTRTFLETGEIEMIDANLEYSIDEPGKATLTGFLTATVVGPNPQEFSIAVESEDSALVRYTVTADGETDSLVETW